MNDYEYEIEGAPVVYTNRAPEPYNPLRRPKISFVKPALVLFAYLIINVVLILLYKCCSFFFAEQLQLYKTTVLTVAILFNVIFIAIISKHALIWFIHVYQHYAPDEIRLKCVFEPSCSEYMILAVQKYGVMKGVIKGADRLLRCHPPNGGKDEP